MMIIFDLCLTMSYSYSVIIKFCIVLVYVLTLISYSIVCRNSETEGDVGLPLLRPI